jgi:iron complex transport system permease protein
LLEQKEAIRAEKKDNPLRPILLVVLFIILPVVLFFASILIGRYAMSTSEVADGFLASILPGRFHAANNVQTVLFQLRIPRILAAMLVGAALATAGAAFQGMFRNPLVSPDILGVSSGAGFGAALALLISGGPMLVQVSAFIFGLSAVAITYAISRFFKMNSTLNLVLGGIAVSAVFSALISLIKYVADPNNILPAITYWLMGGLSAVRLSDLAMVVLPILACMAVLLILRWRLNVLALGDAEAETLGIDTRKFQLIIIVCCTMTTAAAVSISGIVGWVGLVIPHVCRMIVGPNYKVLLPATISMGALFMLFVDDIARNIATIELPLGVLTAIVGAPFFIYLLTQSREGWS